MKIVSLVPSYTEIIYSLDLSDGLIGVTEHCDFPPETKDIQKVGTFAGPNINKITALAPDLVCADPALHKKAIEQLREAGVKVFSPWLRSVSDVLQSMEELSELCSQGTVGENIVGPLRKRVSKVRDEASGKYQPRVFRVMGDDPLITPGPCSIQYDAIRLAGGISMPMENNSYLKVPWEELVRFDPEILLFCGRWKGEPKRPRCKGCLSKEPICQRPVEDIITEKWSGITAVRNNNIFPLSCDILCRPGVRLIDGIEKLSRYFRRNV